MADTQYAILGLVPAIIATLFFLLYRWRFNNFAHIPSPITRNLFLGHLGHIAAGYKNLPSPVAHSDYVFEGLMKSNGSPDFMFFDVRPAQYPVVVVASHELAEQISRSTKQQPTSTTKSPTLQGGIGHLIGRCSILSEEGESWKALRKQLNPGFAPQHLLSLIPVVFEKTHLFLERLDAIAISGKATKLESLCTDVTFDIITEISTGIDCKAQTADPAEEDGMVKNFRFLIATYTGENSFIPAWLQLPTQIKRYIYSQRLDTAIKSSIQERFAAMKQDQSGTRDRSVLALAFKNITTMTPEMLQSITDQIKSFLFAGHDTTSTLIQRLLYELSIRPGHLEKLRAEHDAIFGDRDPMEVFRKQPGDTMKALVYTSACIKEALRLWPPAGSARMSHNGLKLNTTRGEVCLDNCVLYLCHYLIQRDPKVYGETANDFMPDRWLNDHDISSATNDTDDASATKANKIPISAWRPFERGPRNCIGQELAIIEAKIILVCTMRRYDFVKVGLGEVELNEKGMPTIDEKGRYRTKSELINRYSVTAKPFDETVMRVKLR
ncbi:cytochrome P450 52A12 [Plenodomus tracheiphilus IPT5]|uniref:Cytochrome P450 52A12 n=1 Tax=Plenodomus tracheiphilus IPT5 TaxID=1408161 RepID=A0A6A7BQK3_9PLEO|nr:cytochrome P450 52A12 [Plenodomus tracheiphilus IPT5]